VVVVNQTLAEGGCDPTAAATATAATATKTATGGVPYSVMCGSLRWCVDFLFAVAFDPNM